MTVDDDLDEGPVVVRRAVYDAGMKLRDEVAAGARGPEFSIAEAKAASCREAGDTTGAAFWEETFQFLMSREGVSAATETIILEEGERYEWSLGKVVRDRS